MTSLSRSLSWSRRSTLARAARIPARRVFGFMYFGDELRSFGTHIWNEVALDGQWAPVDPSFGRREVSATHIAFQPQRRSRKLPYGEHPLKIHRIPSLKKRGEAEKAER